MAISLKKGAATLRKHLDACHEISDSDRETLGEFLDAITEEGRAKNRVRREIARKLLEELLADLHTKPKKGALKAIEARVSDESGLSMDAVKKMRLRMPASLAPVKNPSQVAPRRVIEINEHDAGPISAASDLRDLLPGSLRSLRDADWRHRVLLDADPLQVWRTLEDTHKKLLEAGQTELSRLKASVKKTR